MFTKDKNSLMSDYFRKKVAGFKPKYRFDGSDKKDFDQWKVGLSAELKRLLGPMPEAVPLNPEIIWEIKSDGLIKRKILIDVEENMSAPALVYIPEKAAEKKAPAILCCHGHGSFGKDSVMGITNSYESQREAEIKMHNYDYGLQMAKKGYVTLAIDWRGFGERSETSLYPGRDECNINYIKGSILGLNLLTLNIFDGMRALDYLSALDQVDSGNIGVMGLSFGGTMATWLAILDDRIKAADIICYSCRFADFAIKNANFCGSQILPGLFQGCDIPDLHGLIAPKALLAEIGIHDKCFDAKGALSCSREVQKIYTAAGVKNNYELDVFEGGHRFSGIKAFDFFDKYLKNK